MNCEHFTIDESLVNELSIQWLEKLFFLPVGHTHDTITLVSTDEMSEQASIFVQRRFPKKKIVFQLSSPLLIEKELLSLRFLHTISTLSEHATKELSLTSSTKNPAILQLVTHIFAHALELGSSDIHLEPTHEMFTLRIRIDGVLHPLVTLHRNLYAPIVSVVKLLSNLDITVKRKPQDGRFSFEHKGTNFDFRLSMIPTIHGESLVMRILDHTTMKLGLDELGFSSFHVSLLKKALHTSHGMVLVTGPTGSGKSTTLYAMINQINSPQRKIITAEDPVEYQLSLIQQLPIDPKGGLSFPLALRHILRQDPDVIMIGEIRDEETLRLAIQASLTGHQVLSTLHTNDALSTIERMMDMGIESYLIGGTLRAIIAQRLVRKLCPSCKHPLTSLPPFLTHLTLPHNATFYEPVGCPHCNMSGYKGREAICEILLITPSLSHLIATRPSKESLLQEAKRDAFVSLFDDGIQKAAQGITSLAEVYKATYQGEDFS